MKTVIHYEIWAKCSDDTIFGNYISEKYTNKKKCQAKIRELRKAHPDIDFELAAVTSTYEVGR